MTMPLSQARAKGLYEIAPQQPHAGHTVRLERLGLTAGTRIRVSRNRFGMVLMDTEGCGQLAIGSAIAEEILVTPSAEASGP
jgi:Fe2+ transport system protein FeoA